MEFLQIRECLGGIGRASAFLQLGLGREDRDRENGEACQKDGVQDRLVGFRSIRRKKTQFPREERCDHDCRQKQEAGIGHGGVEGDEDEHDLPQLPTNSADQGKHNGRGQHREYELAAQRMEVQTPPFRDVGNVHRLLKCQVKGVEHQSVSPRIGKERCQAERTRPSQVLSLAACPRMSFDSSPVTMHESACAIHKKKHDTNQPRTVGVDPKQEEGREEPGSVDPNTEFHQDRQFDHQEEPAEQQGPGCEGNRCQPRCDPRCQKCRLDVPGYRACKSEHAQDDRFRQQQDDKVQPAKSQPFPGKIERQLPQPFVVDPGRSRHRERVKVLPDHRAGPKQVLGIAKMPPDIGISD